MTENKPTNNLIGKCYAAPLGGCSQDVHKEHYFSDALMKLYSNGTLEMAEYILCKNHNNLLNGLDTAILKFASAINQANSQFQANKSAKIFINVEGRRLERWLLKWLIGCWAAGKLENHGHLLECNGIPLVLLRILYGLDPIPEGWGLFISQKIHHETIEKMQTNNAFCTLRVFGPSGGNINGAICSIGSFTFILALTQIDNLKDLDWVHRPSRIIMDVPENRKLIFSVNWN